LAFVNAGIATKNRHYGFDSFSQMIMRNFAEEQMMQNMTVGCVV
jgi:hypothetical protein